MAKSTRITIGRKYTRLTIIACVEPSKADGNFGTWKCKCECGNEIDVLGRKLDWTKSCGCLAKEGRNKAGMSLRKPTAVTITTQYNNHVHSCDQKGMIPLPKEQWLAIVFDPCYYCGEIDKRNAALNKTYQKKCGKTLTDELINEYEVSINGVDRVNCDIGYEIDNCVPCCSMCNYMKLDFDQTEFLNRVKLIYQKHFNHVSNKTKHINK